MSLRSPTDFLEPPDHARAPESSTEAGPLNGVCAEPSCPLHGQTRAQGVCFDILEPVVLASHDLAWKKAEAALAGLQESRSAVGEAGYIQYLEAQYLSTFASAECVLHMIIDERRRLALALVRNAEIVEMILRAPACHECSGRGAVRATGSVSTWLPCGTCVGTGKHDPGALRRRARGLE